MSRDSDRERADLAMDRYAAGDASAFGELYDALAPHLFAFAMNLARRRASAEDVVQQTFLTIHRSRDRWIVGAQVFPWAYAIAHHFFVDLVRRGRHEQLSGEDLEEPDPQPGARSAEADLDSRRRLAGLARQLLLLPENLRMAFQLVALEELTLAEAADVLGITTGNVKVRVHRAREALKAQLEPSVQPEPAP